MGFFNFDDESKPARLGTISLDLLHRKQCEVCPLNHEKCASPKMEPLGAKRPLVYMLGEAPTQEADEANKPFAGKGAKALRFRIPDGWEKDLRWNNVVRTRPPKDRAPAHVEIECCRPSIVKDIEETKPEAIFGFGNVPLTWATGQTGIIAWTGRRIPVKIGEHACWFFPMLDPDIIATQRKFEPRKQSEYGSDDELVFAHHLRRAFEAVDRGLPEPVVHTREDATGSIECFGHVRKVGDVERVLAYFKRAEQTKDVCGFDYETWPLRPYDEGAMLLTVALSFEDVTFSVAIDHKETSWKADERKRIMGALESFLRKSSCVKAVHNLAFELEWSGVLFGTDCIRTAGWHDTMVQAYILDERQNALSLETLGIEYFGINIKALAGVNRRDLRKAPIGEVLSYNGMDARYHRALFVAQRKRLKEERLWDLYLNHLRRVPTMTLTSIKGVPVDQETVETLHKLWTDKLSGIEDELASLEIVQRFKRNVGEPFNPASRNHMEWAAKTLKWKLSSAKTKKRKTEAVAIDEDALRKIDHPLARLVLDWREGQKQLTTYVLTCRLGEKDAAIKPDGRLHTIIHTTKVVTTRTSSSDPNTQNFSKREHKEVRRMVKGKGSLRVVAFDYGQIQARNVAMESLDKNLIKAFWDRYDIHSDFLERIVQKYPRWLVDGPKELNDPKRRKYYRDLAKNKFVFPAFFGAQPRSLASDLKVPEKIAEELYDFFKDRFPNIAKWQEQTRKHFNRYGYVEALSGHRRRAPCAYNQIINAPIQADEAEIVCDAMARLSELDEWPLQASLEIHDDLTFIWPERDIEKHAEVVIDHMLNVPFKWAHCVPIVVEMSVGYDWGTTEAVEDFASDTWKGGVPREKLLQALEASHAAGPVKLSKKKRADDNLAQRPAQADTDAIEEEQRVTWGDTWDEIAD